MNKYYVLVEGGRIDGPYTFKQAMNQKSAWDAMQVGCEILKLYIGLDGKEVDNGKKK